MQKTIYVKDQAEWDEVKKKADESGMTVSRYLLGSVQLDRIEKKLDLVLQKEFKADPKYAEFSFRDVEEETAQTFGDSVLAKARKEAKKMGQYFGGAAAVDNEPMVPIIDESRNVERDESEILAKAQKKLEAVKAQQKIQTPKGPVKANKAMSNFISYSKDRQLVKK